MRNLELGKESVMVIKINDFKIKDEETAKELNIPNHFLEGGFYVAIKHEHKTGPLYRVFFNKISGKITQNSFFKEIKSREIAGILIDPAANEEESYMWDVNMEEFNFEHVSDYNVSEKALYFMSDIMLMPIDEFKEKADEVGKAIEVRSPLDSDYDDKNVDIIYEGMGENFKWLDIAIKDVQDHVLDAMGGKYNHTDLNPAEALIWSERNGKSINMFNATKYIHRYLNEEGDKSNNYTDLTKAIHYLLFEMGRRNKFSKNEQETEEGN